MTANIATPNVDLSHSEIKGLVQENYGTVTFVYNFPQDSDVIRQQTADRIHAELPSCPYRGLFAFQPEDARFFFGREAAIDRIERLVNRGRVSAVTGASGSGKSSLVFAGLVPVLVKTDGWIFTTFRPGEDPFHGLAGALIPILTETGADGSASWHPEAISKLAAELRSEPPKLVDKLQAIRHQNPGKRLLLIADQFEEIYSLCPKVAVRKQFLDMLLLATFGQGAPFLHLLLTIRADFLGALVSYRGLADALQNQIDLLGPMTRAELTDAVIKPAELMGVRYEAHLVERILDDLGDDDGSLPLLEFALTRLWEEQSSDRTLTHTAYENIGRVSGAIRQHAEAAYARLDQEEQHLTRRLFRRLVSLTIDTDEVGERTTRRQVELQSLDEATQVLAKGELANRRLVVVSHVADQRDMVEIVHETLLTNWPALAKWIQEDKETILRLQQLSTAAVAYTSAKKSPDLLYRGRQLREYTTWANAHRSELTTDERAFLEDSLHHQRWRNLVQYGGYALTALVTILAVVWFVWLRPPGAEPQIPIPMPPEDFNMAVANFAIEGLDKVEDADLVNTLTRDANAIASEFAQILQTREGAFEAALGDNANVNVLMPERFELPGNDLQSVAQTAKYLNANILVYGTLRMDNGRYWFVEPHFYIDHSATADRSAEIMEDQALATRASFIPGLASDRNASVAELAPSLEVLFALYRGLDFYDQGTVSGYKQAAQTSCSSAETLEASGIVKGVDLLFLFCGHSYSELLLLDSTTEETRLAHLENAIRAYQSAIRLNPDGLRARVSLPALLVMVYKPGYSCSEGDIQRIVEAGTNLEAAETLISRAPSIRQGTQIGYLLNRGHVRFWLGLCRDFDRREESWQAARGFYQQALDLSEHSDSERDDIVAFSAAEAHAQLAYIDFLVNWFNSQGAELFDEGQEQLLNDAAEHFDRSLTLLLPYQSEPRSAKLARDIAVDSIYIFCSSGRSELAHSQLERFASSVAPWSKEEIVAGVDLRDSELRKECGL